MGSIVAKPMWVDSDINGTLQCDDCPYKSNKSEYLEEHRKSYHPNDRKPDMILYMRCRNVESDDNLEARNKIMDYLGDDYRYIDVTGGQGAFYDGDLKNFGDKIVEAAKLNNIKIYEILRMYDPGLGLEFPSWWVNSGVENGLFQKYDLPDDIKVSQEQINAEQQAIKDYMDDRNNQKDCCDGENCCHGENCCCGENCDDDCGCGGSDDDCCGGENCNKDSSNENGDHNE